MVNVGSYLAWLPPVLGTSTGIKRVCSASASVRQGCEGKRGNLYSKMILMDSFFLSNLSIMLFSYRGENVQLIGYY